MSPSGADDMRMQSIIDTNAVIRAEDIVSARLCVLRKVRNDEISVPDALIVLNALGIQHPEEEMPLEESAIDVSKLSIGKKRTRS